MLKKRRKTSHRWIEVSQASNHKLTKRRRKKFHLAQVNFSATMVGSKPLVTIHRHCPRRITLQKFTAMKKVPSAKPLNIIKLVVVVIELSLSTCQASTRMRFLTISKT